MQHMQQNIPQSENYLKLIMLSNISLVARNKKSFSAFAKFLEISPFLVSKVSSLLDAVIIFSKGSPVILKTCWKLDHHCHVTQICFSNLIQHNHLFLKEIVSKWKHLEKSRCFLCIERNPLMLSDVFFFWQITKLAELSTEKVSGIKYLRLKTFERGRVGGAKNLVLPAISLQLFLWKRVKEGYLCLAIIQCKRKGI